MPNIMNPLQLKNGKQVIKKKHLSATVDKTFYDFLYLFLTFPDY